MGGYQKFIKGDNQEAKGAKNEAKWEMLRK